MFVACLSLSWKFFYSNVSVMDVMKPRTSFSSGHTILRYVELAGHLPRWKIHSLRIFEPWKDVVEDYLVEAVETNCCPPRRCSKKSWRASDVPRGEFGRTPDRKLATFIGRVARFESHHNGLGMCTKSLRQLVRQRRCPGKAVQVVIGHVFNHFIVQLCCHSVLSNAMASSGKTR